MSGPSEDGSGRPHLHSSESFTTMDSSDADPARPGQTAAETANVSTRRPSSSAQGEKNGSSPDVFERQVSADSGVEGESQGDEGFVLSRSVQNPSEELPIELISLTDRFINSLSARVHNSPPTIEKIASLFQVFYSRAESHIATHISTLASRINRERQPEASPITRGSALSRLANKRSQDDFRQNAWGRQMLTASEVEEKRKARRALEYKRTAMEEAAERRVCELVYDKLWRHKSTLDEVRDEKLRSKTAALLLVGIDLKELGVDIDVTAIDESKQQEANDCLAQARECLARMNDHKYPLGKLQELATAHKAIVDALTKLLPSSTSADEILPTLIYSLVTCPPEGIGIVSNLLFIQRFRSSNKIDGETAYCLTNLEAAISFLENVELSSLRADELQEGPLKTPSETHTPDLERLDPVRPPKEITTSSVSAVSAESEFSKPEVNRAASSTLPRPLPPAPQQRRLSNLFQPPAKVIEAANDAVRNTADQSLKNIGATLDNSFSFLFGRLKELQTNQGPGSSGNGPILPKTLDEARRLVANPPANKESPTQDELASINAMSVEEGAQISSPGATTLTSGSRTPRDRSTDSARTQATSKRSIATPLRDDSVQTPSSATPNPLESMRTFGNTLNPLNHIPGMIKNFGRNIPETPSARSVSPAAVDRMKVSPASVDGGNAAAISHPTPAKLDPPIQRFLELQDASELRVGEIAILLHDYKRLAAALKSGTGTR